MRADLRGLALGLLLGMSLAVVPSCGKKCNPTTCKTGCCNAKDECVAEPTVAACGVEGAKCSACGEGQACEAGQCVTPSGTGDGGTDGGAVDAGPPRCVYDDDCASRDAGLICNKQTGGCYQGQGCNADQECQVSEINPPEDGGEASDDPCYRSGLGCRCDRHDAPPSTSGFNWAGTCRQRKPPCAECTTDLECGVGDVFQPPDARGEGRCVQLPDDTTGKKYCLFQRVGQCACGTVDYVVGTGNARLSVCKPQTNSCNQVGCNTDMDCSAGTVCSVNNPDAGANSCGGVCVPRCRWDFQERRLVSPGCPPTQVCWVDSKNLNPASPFYGSGRCKPACTSDMECQSTTTNPFGGPNLKCSGELLMGGGRDAKRCRANGVCMDNLECPALPNDQPYLGYCDRGRFTCETDCRTGNDPITGRPYSDCRTPYACASDGGINICKRLNCAEQGGSAIACSRGMLCQPEDRDGNGQPEIGAVPATELDEDLCFEAPRTPGPYCHQCMSDDDCSNLQVPSYLTCANGAKNPSCSLLPSRCVPVPGAMDPKNVCGIPTANDFTATAGAALGCPQGYNVRVLYFNEAGKGQNDDLCSSHAECNPGSEDGGGPGRCETTGLAPKREDGGIKKACVCTAGPMGSTACPNNRDAGVRSVCQNLIPGSPSICIDSVVCMPQSFAYKPVGMPNVGADYGCGLQ